MPCAHPVPRFPAPKSEWTTRLMWVFLRHETPGFIRRSDAPLREFHIGIDGNGYIRCSLLKILLQVLLVDAEYRSPAEIAFIIATGCQNKSCADDADRQKDDSFHWGEVKVKHRKEIRACHSSIVISFCHLHLSPFDHAQGDRMIAALHHDIPYRDSEIN